VTTSLLGYGGTAERRTERDPDIRHEAEVLEAVVRRAGRPAHLVGHSFGGLAALAVALRRKVALRSLAILEAPAVDALRRAGEHRHDRAFREMTDGYFRAFRAGERAAVAVMIDFFGGPGTFAGWPERVRAYAVETTAVNLLDWASAAGFDLAPAALARVDIPTLVVHGGASHPAVRRANALVARSVPDAAVVTIAGAAHFMIATHAEETARVIADHVTRAERGAPSAVDG
jgi:pimeloyl-ACP methyl ester carboxylesterase